MNRRYEEPDEGDDDSVCEHGIGFDETCEWCDYEEDGPQELETTLDSALEQPQRRTGSKGNDMELADLIGEHVLSGVDMTDEDMPSDWSDESAYHGSVCRFILDGRTYTAREDDNDGYRSAMRDLVEGGEVKNVFPPQRVLCSLQTEGEYGGKGEILVMRDVVTGKEVLQVGTDNMDDYYPSFVANFRPENMAINSQATV